MFNRTYAGLVALAMLVPVYAPPAMADQLSTRAAVGGGLGAALGAFIGGELGGRNAAIIGSGLAGAAGTAIATDGYDRPVYPERRGASYPCPPGQWKKGRCRDRYAYDD
ncbi:hypothetical protein [Thiocapsa marina]|uniref:17 kDa surface antigen n=1 Tax=Thiocapsa marina 5811 TaxID=768671 RepID=F9UIP1_9GAMM|nr:hypothetical protein [Thiocapsa marina]EGV15923.1 hypothetical protein ThimaDRAFT_4794 [Thiocapsa marina 5811]